MQDITTDFKHNIFFVSNFRDPNTHLYNIYMAVPELAIVMGLYPNDASTCTAAEPGVRTCVSPCLSTIEFYGVNRIHSAINATLWLATDSR
jgi:hypothetical protein